MKELDYNFHDALIRSVSTPREGRINIVIDLYPVSYPARPTVQVSLIDVLNWKSTERFLRACLKKTIPSTWPESMRFTMTRRSRRARTTFGFISRSTMLGGIRFIAEPYAWRLCSRHRQGQSTMQRCCIGPGQESDPSVWSAISRSLDSPFVAMILARSTASLAIVAGRQSRMPPTRALKRPWTFRNNIGMFRHTGRNGRAECKSRVAF